MGMERYLYWLILLNMIANVVAYVPRILLADRFNGAVLSIPVAVLAGTLALFWYTSVLSRFPGKGIPEILQEHAPGWVRFLYLLLQGIAGFIAGSITLVAFVDITKSYINPSMSKVLIILLFGTLAGCAALMQSKSLLFALEVLLICNLPFVLLIFWKVYTNELFSWDAVWSVAGHFHKLPTWTAISAGFYTFLGFSNLAIFNRFLPNMNRKRLWVVPLMGLVNLFTTMFVPIGMNGTILAASYTFPWIATADTFRMEFGFVERILYVFLLLYIGISLLSAMVHWHTGVEWFKSMLPPVWRERYVFLPVMLVGLFIAVVTCMTLSLDSDQTFMLAQFSLCGTIPLILVTCIWLTWIGRRNG